VHILSEIRQRTAAQRNASTPTPATPKQGSPKLLVSSTPSPDLQRDASALSGPPERTAVPSLQSNVLPRRPGSPATSVPGMGKQNAYCYLQFILFSLVTNKIGHFQTVWKWHFIWKLQSSYLIKQEFHIQLAITLCSWHLLMLKPIA